MVNAIDVMGIIKELEEKTADSFEALASSHTEEQLRELLPVSVRQRSWISISRVLYDMRRVSPTVLLTRVWHNLTRILSPRCY